MMRLFQQREDKYFGEAGTQVLFLTLAQYQFESLARGHQPDPYRAGRKMKI